MNVFVWDDTVYTAGLYTVSTGHFLVWLLVID